METVRGHVTASQRIVVVNDRSTLSFEFLSLRAHSSSSTSRQHADFCEDADGACVRDTCGEALVRAWGSRVFHGVRARTCVPARARKRASAAPLPPQFTWL